MRLSVTKKLWDFLCFLFFFFSFLSSFLDGLAEVFRTCFVFSYPGHMQPIEFLRKNSSINCYSRSVRHMTRHVLLSLFTVTSIHSIRKRTRNSLKLGKFKSQAREKLILMKKMFKSRNRLIRHVKVISMLLLNNISYQKTCILLVNDMQ